MDLILTEDNEEVILGLKDYPKLVDLEEIQKVMGSTLERLQSGEVDASNSILANTEGIFRSVLQLLVTVNGVPVGTVLEVDKDGNPLKVAEYTLERFQKRMDVKAETMDALAEVVAATFRNSGLSKPEGETSPMVCMPR